MNSHHRWLHEQLPQWERDGIVTAENATSLRQRHPLDESASSVGQIVMGALGALLIGSGLIAVIGYNWDDFSRPVRLLFAFLPLLGSQIASFRVLQRGDAEATWVRETVALLQALATGACLAIVSQIYNLGGEWPDFLFWWMLLSLPLVWVLHSQAVAIFYLIAIATWSVSQIDHTGPWYAGALIYPLLALGLAPFWPGWPPRWQLSRALQWILTLSAGAGLGAAACASAQWTETKYYHGDACVWLWLFTLAAMFLLPVKPATIHDTHRHDPQVSLCGFVLLMAGFVMSFKSEASSILKSLEAALRMPWAWGSLLLAVIFSISAIRQQRWGLIAVASIVVTPMVPLAVGPNGYRVLPWLMSLHLLLMGVLLIVLDLAGRRGSPRLGATLICTLIIVRMFESELSLLVKGVAFIVVGIAFLAFNLLMSRRRRASTLPAA